MVSAIKSVVDSKKALLTYPAAAIDHDTEMALRAIHSLVAQGYRITGLSDAFPTPGTAETKLTWKRREP